MHPTSESLVLWTHIVYLITSVALTVWVGRTLHKNGRVFLVDAMHGNEKLADSVNHLLVVGFYLINAGYVTLSLKYGDKPWEVSGAVESFSTQIGLVLLVLGFMHFFNLYVIAGMRRRANQPPPSSSGRPSYRDVPPRDPPRDPPPVPPWAKA